MGKDTKKTNEKDVQHVQNLILITDCILNNNIISSLNFLILVPVLLLFQIMFLFLGNKVFNSKKSPTSPT